jgi:hypothetical protein
MHRRLSEADSEKLANELAGLERLSGEKLNQHFKSMYRADPPPRMRRALLIQALAYRLQEKALGGLRPAIRRLLASAADDAAARLELPRFIERRAGRPPLVAGEKHSTARAQFYGGMFVAKLAALVVAILLRWAAAQHRAERIALGAEYPRHIPYRPA